MNPKELENVMVAKQAAQSMLNQWEAVQEYVNMIAKARRQYFLACVQEGFTDQEALYMAAMFQFPTGQPGSGA